MSIKASKTAIGAFVLAALCLAVAGVVFLGGGKLFVPQKKFVMYFDGSVKGLSDGAAVVFRGVKIGTVSDIRLRGNVEEMRFRVPVIAKINMDKFQMGDGKATDSDYHQDLIDQGLRAQLQTQSLVTGQLVINFDFYPDTLARLVKDDSDYLQVPTIPSTTAEFAQKLEELPLQQLVERSNALVGGLERMVNSPDMRNAPRNLNLALADARELMGKMDSEIEILSADARKTLHAANDTFRHADRVLAFEEGPPAELVKNFDRTLLDARKSLGRFDETLDAVRNTATDKRTTYQLRHALKELEETSRSLGFLAEYLNRHPEALLRGKPDQEGK